MHRQTLLETDKHGDGIMKIEAETIKNLVNKLQNQLEAGKFSNAAYTLDYIDDELMPIRVELWKQIQTEDCKSA